MGILQKKRWTDEEKLLFKNNIKVLAAQENISIKDLQAIIGMKNIFRKDTLRPNNSLITLLSKFFNVSEEWLVTFHAPAVQEQPPDKKNTPGRLIDTSGLSRSDMACLRMVINLLEARHPVYTDTLRVNIAALHQGLQNEPKCMQPEPVVLKKPAIIIHLNKYRRWKNRHENRESEL